MQNITLNPNGTLRLLNMVSSNDVSVGYLPTFNYLDGHVDFDSTQINNADYSLGYSFDKTPSTLTHFNGFNNCSIAFGRPNSSANYDNVLVKKYCYVKTKYISASGTSTTISVTSGSVLFASAGGWETSGSVKYMVNGSIPNVKYFLTDDINEKPTSGVASTYPEFLATKVVTGDIFPVYFPKRDTLVLKGDKLDRG
jgi:hypothetical protein